MKKRKFGLFKIILIVFVSASCFAGETPPHIYIALGDSVSSGYGLPGYIASPQGKHPSLFFEKLKNRGFADSYHNFAITGYTTTNLLNLLNNTGSDEKMLFHQHQKVVFNDYFIKLVKNGVQIDERQIKTDNDFVVLDKNNQYIAFYTIENKKYVRKFLFA